MMALDNMHAAEHSLGGVVALRQSHMMYPAVCCVCTACQQQKSPVSQPLHQVAQQLHQVAHQLQNKLCK